MAGNARASIAPKMSRSGDPAVGHRWARTRAVGPAEEAKPEQLPDIVRGYGIAGLMVVVTVGLKLVVGDLGSEHPFVLLPVAVIVAAWYGGRGPGIFATVLVALASAVFFIGPIGTQIETSDLLGLIALVGEGVLVVIITVGLRGARARAEAQASAARKAQRELALALAVRDEMLLLWTQKLRGPLADVEAHGRAALADLEHEAYPGTALTSVRALIDEVAHVGRVTARWDDRQQADLASTSDALGIG
ncbi:MAG: hypothetical protein NVS9B6_09780 [Candidatus Limnocylindrales bacterium]